MASSFSQKHEAQLSVSPWLIDIALKVIKIQGTIITKDNKWICFYLEVDNGCQLMSIHPQVVRQYRLPKIELPTPIPMSNADGSPNQQSMVMHVAWVWVTLYLGEHQELMEALILDIGRNNMLLGQDWLMVHNPCIDWANWQVVFNRCPTRCCPQKKEVNIKKTEMPELDKNGLSKGTKPWYIDNFNHLFEKKNFDKLPGQQEWDHEINLILDALKELPAQNYQMMTVELQALDDFVNEELKTGKICLSKLLYAAPCFFITKKDGGWWLVQDYRKVNTYTIKDKTLLPCIDDMINTLIKGQYYTKMDIIWGYNNVWIEEGHEWKAAFLMPWGLFKLTVMYFRLCNSPRMFSRMMVTIFRDMIQAGKCAIYMDDIVFCGKTKEELWLNILEGLWILEKHDLYVKESKCYWEVEEVPVLRHIIGYSQTCMERGKVKAILDWHTPKSKNNVHIWNGFCNFYRWYIKGYLSVAKLLTWLLRSHVKPIIAQPLLKGTFCIKVDASGFMLGGVLS